MTGTATAGLVGEARRVERVALRRAARYGIDRDVVDLRAVARNLREVAAVVELQDAVLVVPAPERCLILTGMSGR